MKSGTHVPQKMKKSWPRYLVNLHHTLNLELSEALRMNQDLLKTKIIVHAVRIINNDRRVRVN